MQKSDRNHNRRTHEGAGLRHKHPVISVPRGSSSRLRVTKLIIYVGQNHPLTLISSSSLESPQGQLAFFPPVLLAHAVTWLVTLMTGDSRLSKNVGCQSQYRALTLQVLSLSSLKGEGSRAPSSVLSLPAAGVPCWDLSQRCRGLPRQASPGVRSLPAEDLLQTGRRGDLSLLQASPTTPAPQK